MASKSKKRRRVLGASCILAALIIAGSSFAWFTSKDEVTNRLTANADYGVSIVESFVPPKNWLPGQEINKDVYAVNTGTVDAFVKESITGVLNYTYEQVVDDFAADCVTLDDKTRTAIDGATTDEAGGFLAWTTAKVTVDRIDGDYAKKSEVDVTATDDGGADSKTFTTKYTVGSKEYYQVDGDDTLYTINNGVYTATTKTVTSAEEDYKTGPINSARINDAEDAGNTVNNNAPGVTPERWTPPADGIYIFRRAIDTKVPDTDPNAPAGATKTVYQYAGYRFVKGDGTANNPDKYYKIVIGDKEKANYPTDGNDPVTALEAPFAEWNFDINASSEDIPGITIDENGAIKDGTPKVRYVKEYEVKNANALFTYNPEDAAHGNVATLTANYVPDIEGTGDVSAQLAALQAAQQALSEAQTAVTNAQNNLNTLSDTAHEKSAEAAAAETEYENALGAYNSALSRYNHTLYAYQLASAIADATEDLYDAADARAVFQAQFEKAEDDMEAAWRDDATNPSTNSVAGKAGHMLTTYADVFNIGRTGAGNGDNSPVSFKSLFGDTSNAPTTGDSLAKKINDLYTTYGNNTYDGRFGSMKSNMDKMHTLWGEMVTLLGTGTPAVGTPGEDGYVPANPGIVANMEKLRDYNAGNSTTNPVTDADAKLIREQLAADFATLKQKMGEYNKAYAKLAEAVEASQEPTLTNVVVDPTGVAEVATAASHATSLLDDEFRTAATDDKDLEQLLKDYEGAYKTWHDMSNTTEEAPTAGQDAATIGQANYLWKQAVDNYNSAIATAVGEDNTAATYSTSYKGKVNVAQPTLNGYFRVDTANNNYLTDQTDAIIADAKTKGYAPQGTGTNSIGTDGKFATSTAYPDYKTYTISTGIATDADNDGVFEVPDYVDAASAATTGKERVAPATNTYTQIDVTSDTLKHEKVNENNTGTFTGALTVDNLEDNLDTATTGLYGGADKTADTATDDSKYKKWTAAKQAETDANTALTNAQNTLANATTTLAGLQGNVDAAQASYDQALGLGSPINIIIKLAAKDSELGWTYDTVDIGNKEASGTRGDEANFYLNNVLKGGETSTKLIDSVYLDETTSSKAYKTLVFDLNVGMDSAQVTYDADQRNYATDAVTAENGFNMKATTITDSDKVEWTQR